MKTSRMGENMGWFGDERGVREDAAEEKMEEKEEEEEWDWTIGGRSLRDEGKSEGKRETVGEEKVGAPIHALPLA